jgi:hypothetical protein
MFGGRFAYFLVRSAPGAAGASTRGVLLCGELVGYCQGGEAAGPAVFCVGSVG